MNKHWARVLVASVGFSVLAGLVITGQNQRIKDLEENQRRLKNWAELMQRMIRTHYENGGTLNIPAGLSDDIDAYLIFRANGMF